MLRAERDKNFAKLPELVPEWKDPTARKAGVEKILQTMVSEGLVANAELVTNPVALQRMWESEQYRLMKSEEARKTSLAAKKVEGLPPAVRPGTSQAGQSSGGRAAELTQRAMRTGKDADVLAAIAARL
jgi:hypothetical protein